MKKQKRKKPSPTKTEKHTNEKVLSNGKLYERTIKETKYYAPKNNSNIIFLAFSILLTWLKKFNLFN